MSRCEVDSSGEPNKSSRRVAESQLVLKAAYPPLTFTGAHTLIDVGQPGEQAYCKVSDSVSS
jgi:hypothetical protein